MAYSRQSYLTEHDSQTRRAGSALPSWPGKKMEESKPRHAAMADQGCSSSVGKMPCRLISMSFGAITSITSIQKTLGGWCLVPFHSQYHSEHCSGSFRRAEPRNFRAFLGALQRRPQPFPQPSHDGSPPDSLELSVRGLPLCGRENIALLCVHIPYRAIEAR